MYINIYNKIEEYETIIIHRHAHPDGDAMGSQIGLLESIKETFPNKKVYAVGDINEKFSFIGNMNEISDDVYQDALVIVLDTPEVSMISDERYKKGKFLIKIDHHISRSNYANLNLVESNEISCACVVTKMIFTTSMKLSQKGAMALFTGMVTDSGRFRYDGVLPETFELAAQLLRYGFNPQDVYNRLYIDKLEMVQLRAKLTLSFHISPKGIAYMKNTKEDIKKYHTDFFTISRGMVGVMSGIQGIDIWVNFTEDEQNKVIAEIRSNKYNINPVATKYGGGGHKMASGATLNSFDEADKMIQDLEKLLEN